MKNTGLIIKPISDDKKAYILGASPAPFVIHQPDGNWFPSLPVKEIQLNRFIDTFNCTGESVTTQVEIFMKKVFGVDVNYSARFVGIMAGTRPPGNDIQTVWEAVRKHGLIPEEMLPFDDTITSIDEYYSFKGADEAACRKAGQDWLKQWNFKHEWVFGDGLTREERLHNMKVALTGSPLAIAVHGWAQDANGNYISLGIENHMTTCYNIPQLLSIFDTYDPVLKTVDQPINYCKRISITKRETEAEKTSWLITLIRKILKITPPQKNVPDTITPPSVIPTPPQKSPRERIYEEAVKCLGTDASPADAAPDELGCMDSVNQIVFRATGEYIETPGISTFKGFMALVERADKWVRVTDPEPGNIIISPTGLQPTDSPIKNGHIGIFGKDKKIMSNSSGLDNPAQRGKWVENYTLDTWVERYRNKGKFPIYYFKHK